MFDRFVIGQYENNMECAFGNDLALDLDKGPNGEGAAADRYAVFYRNGDFPNCGTLLHS